jgi:hypothetical protein
MVRCALPRKPGQIDDSFIFTRMYIEKSSIAGVPDQSQPSS